MLRARLLLPAEGAFACSRHQGCGPSALHDTAFDASPPFVLGRLVATGLASVLATSSNGCFQGCTDEYVYPSYRITVVDEATGALICDADVTMGPGVMARKSHVGCGYVLEIPRPTAPHRMVTIFAEKPGYVPASKEVSTAHDSDECGHAIGKPVKLVLTPE